MLKIPVQYVISETEDHTAGRTTQAPKTKVSLVKVIFIVVLALALGSMQRVNTSSPREGGVPSSGINYTKIGHDLRTK